jgi:hypothetical protein
MFDFGNTLSYSVDLNITFQSYLWVSFIDSEYGKFLASKDDPSISNKEPLARQSLRSKRDLLVLLLSSLIETGRLQMEEGDRQDRKPELTLDQAVKNMQAAWTKFRDAQLYAFHAAVPVLEFARAHEDDFRVYCQDRSLRGDLPETQVAELMIQNDPEAGAISGERRAEYGAAIGWFATRTLCPETDPEKAVQLAKQKGRIKGIAELYRNRKDAENPDAAAAKEKAKVTKAANGKRAKLLNNAAGNGDDSISDPKGVAADRRESTKPVHQADGSHPRSALAKEFGRQLDAAGVVPLSPADLPDLAIGLYLVLHDQSIGQPRMFEILYTETVYRLLLDNIIQRHQETQTSTSAEAT